MALYSFHEIGRLLKMHRIQQFEALSEIMAI